MLSIAAIIALEDPAERIRQSILRRVLITSQVRTTEQQEAVKEACRRDIKTFINDWCWTYDPRNVALGLPTDIPFHLFEYQEEFLDYLDRKVAEKRNGLVEKSRDMGATWLFVGWYVHSWLFKPGFKGGIGSRKLDLVDRIGNPDSIFSKIRFLLYHLPHWMLPEGFNRRIHDTYCVLTNPANGASITGEGGIDIGRGGRNLVYLIDEHASILRAEEVDAAVSNNASSVFYLSTPKGAGNLFARKRFGGKIEPFTMHWSRHPWKDQAWYDLQREEYTDVLLAQEIDIDYAAAVEGVAIPAKWVRAAVGLEIEPGKKVTAGLDIGESSDPSVYTPRRGNVVGMPISWSGANTTQTTWRAVDHAREDGVHTLLFDRDGIGAGMYGTLDSYELPLPFEVVGIRSGASPTDAMLPDAPSVPAGERFMNFRVEMWWRLRLRFERTWEHVEGVQEHKPEDLISIPDHPELIAQLSQPLIFYTEDGRMRLESKKQMLARGFKSPDHADSLVYCYAPIKNNQLLAFVV